MCLVMTFIPITQCYRFFLLFFLNFFRLVLPQTESLYLLSPQHQKWFPTQSLYLINICSLKQIGMLTLFSFFHILLLLFSRSVVSDSLRPHGLPHARPPCPSPSTGAFLNSCPSSWWCHPTILSSVVPFSSCLQSVPASGSFLMSWLFESGGQSIGVSASTSVLPMNIQDWLPLGCTGLIALLFKGPSRVFSNTTVQKHQFFSAQLSLWSNSHIHTWLLEKP